MSVEQAETTWIALARAGDAAAFARLVEAYQRPVYNLAYRMLGDAEEAEDAAQETFVRAYVHFNAYDSAFKFSSWLLSIASHYCVDLLRRRRGTWLSVEDLPARVEADPSTLQPEQAVVQRQTTDEVQRLLSALDPAHRALVVLRYWYDMPYQEIAAVMGISEGTVKTRLHRARGKLAREAQQPQQAEPRLARDASGQAQGTAAHHPADPGTADHVHSQEIQRRQAYGNY